MSLVPSATASVAPTPSGAAWVRTTGLGAALHVVLGVAVGAGVGTPAWPVVGTAWGAVVGAVLGAATGLVVGGVLGLPVLRRSRVPARAAAALLAVAAAGLVLALTTHDLRPAAAVGLAALAAAWGAWTAPVLTRSPSRAVVRRALLCLGAGLVTGLAVGAVAGLGIGIVGHPPTAPVALLEGAFLGSFCGVALGCLAVLVGVLPGAARSSR